MEAGGKGTQSDEACFSGGVRSPNQTCLCSLVVSKIMAREEKAGQAPGSLQENPLGELTENDRFLGSVSAEVDWTDLE